MVVPILIIHYSEGMFLLTVDLLVLHLHLRI